MAKVEPFEKYTKDYEKWFEKYRGFYLSEVNLLRKLLEWNRVEFKKGLEIGVGSGRFAVPLGVKYGVDPSPKMLKIALSRGIKVAKGVAEYLPIKTESVDFTLMVTAICFVDDPEKSFGEVERVLSKGSYFLLAFVDRESPLSRLYELKRHRSKFYGPARFFSAQELLNMAQKNTRLRFIDSGQTIFGLEDGEYPPLRGFGKGSFVALLFKKV